MILAKRIESALSKEEILWLYLNQIDVPLPALRHRRGGALLLRQVGERHRPGEAALLASLPKGPTEIDPWKHPERAKDRQKYVLSQMVRYSTISKADEAEKFARTPIQLVRSPSPSTGRRPSSSTR